MDQHEQYLAWLNTKEAMSSDFITWAAYQAGWQAAVDSVSPAAPEGADSELPVKPWDKRMQEYFAQGSVQMRTPAAFMADEIADWRACAAQAAMPDMSASLMTIARGLIAEVNASDEEEEEKNLTIRGIGMFHSEILKHYSSAPQSIQVAPAVAAVTEKKDGKPDLHAAIMNLPCKMGRAVEMNGATKQAYKEGHRDARHAAAELVAAALSATVPPAKEQSEQDKTS